MMGQSKIILQSAQLSGTSWFDISAVQLGLVVISFPHIIILKGKSDECFFGSKLSPLGVDFWVLTAGQWLSVRSSCRVSYRVSYCRLPWYIHFIDVKVSFPDDGGLLS